jgi:uncharacterized protein (TIGR00369 family)
MSAGVPWGEALPPGVEERVRAHFLRVPLLRTLGVSLTALGAGRCEMRMPYREELGQQHGFFHGGLIGTLTDSASGHAASTLWTPEAEMLTVEYKLNFLAPAQGTQLIARAVVLRNGRTLSVIQADAYCEKEGRTVHCATALTTYMALTRG